MAYETHNAIMQLIHEKIHVDLFSRIYDHIGGQYIIVTCTHGDLHVEIFRTELMVQYSRRKPNPAFGGWDVKRHVYELSDPKTTISVICDKIKEYHNTSK